MKYIEELTHGEIFTVNNKIYLLTCDIKKDRKRLCYCLTDGLPNWFDPDNIIETIELYTLDENQNISPIKSNYNVPNKIKDIS